MMKTADSPRRIYVRKSITHVCFAGRLYGLADSAISPAHPVVCEPMKSDGGKSRIQVTQSVPHKAKVVEVWRTTKF